MSHNVSLRFASKTAFQNLAVESGEETEEEEVEEVQPEPELKQSEPEHQFETVPVVAHQPKPLEKKTDKAVNTKKNKRGEPGSVLSKSEPSKPATTDVETKEYPGSTAGASTPLEESKLSPDVPGSVANPLAVVHDVPSGPQQAPVPNGLHSPTIAPKGKPRSATEKVVKSVPSDEHTLKRIGQNVAKHEGNVEVHTSSSKQIIDPLPTSKAERIVEKVNETNKRHANVLTRSVWTFVMIGGFIGLLLMGHVYMIMLVLTCQTIVYREVTALFSLSHKEPESLPEEERRDPWSKTLNWYFFAVTNYFLYGESIIYYFKHIVFADIFFLPFATNHRFISFTLYCIGFVGFVTSLKKYHLKRQFSLFGWVHMTLLTIVVSSHFIVNNILEGMIWFWVPASLVICNDIFAYIWGVTTGRTPLLALSPKKTVEGFVGAVFSTLIFGYFWGTFFMRFNYMICPVENLGVTAWSDVQCKPNPVFVWREWRVPFSVALPVIGKVTSISWAPYQFHLLVMATFASLVAPFGGFFASGFKRAFNLKDFGDSIPGHGGMTDRMDCQFLMGMFSYVYYSTVIREHHVTVGSILQAIASGLTVEEQVQLFNDLKRYLEARGVLNFLVK